MPPYMIADYSHSSWVLLLPKNIVAVGFVVIEFTPSKLDTPPMQLDSGVDGTH